MLSQMAILHFLMAEYLGCFHILTTINNAAININNWYIYLFELFSLDK